MAHIADLQITRHALRRAIERYYEVHKKEVKRPSRWLRIMLIVAKERKDFQSFKPQYRTSRYYDSRYFTFVVRGEGSLVTVLVRYHNLYKDLGSPLG